MTEIFVPAIGQFDNIGDIVLRRHLLSWLRPLGNLHIYVGAAPSGYAEALGALPVDDVYRSFPKWYAVAFRGAIRGDAVYVCKPGEIQLTLAGMKEHVGVLPLLALIRSRGGVVARVGAGARNFAGLPRLMMLPSIRLSNLVLWRDPATAQYLGGGVMPDLAFGEAGRDDDAGIRDTLAVSLRYDRRMPPIEWIEGVQTFARMADLRLSVVTQVLRDRERSRSLACALGAQLIDWDGRDPAAQELTLRSEYRRCALVLSDRLHVLITALAEGSATLALLPEHSDKIQRHFAAAGIGNVSVDVRGFETADIVAVLQAAARRGPAPLDAARDDLRAARTRVAELIESAGRVAVLAEAPG